MFGLFFLVNCWVPPPQTVPALWTSAGQRICYQVSLSPRPQNCRRKRLPTAVSGLAKRPYAAISAC